MLRITGLIRKYHTVLLNGILKLFYVNNDGIHSFIRCITTKWPLGSSKRVDTNKEYEA